MYASTAADGKVSAMSMSGPCKMHKHSNGMNIYIPATVVQDSRFPLRPEDKLKVIIQGNSILITVVE